MVVAIVLAIEGTSVEAVRPTKFCECPEHDQPIESASISDGSAYRLFAYNDAFRAAQKGLWCYTRAVWFKEIETGGRFEWRSSGSNDLMSGAIRTSTDPCGAYYNHYESSAAPSKNLSTIEHGTTLQSSREIVLYHATDEEFNPGWAMSLMRRVSSLVGFAPFPGTSTPTRIAIRVSARVIGTTSPYTIEYMIESPSRTSLDLHEFGRSPAFAEKYPRLYWEAAAAQGFYVEMVKQRSGFIEGSAPVVFKVGNVPVVQPAIGRLMVLAPGSPPPPPDAPLKGVLLVGTATAFRIGTAPNAPRNLGIQ